MAFTRPVVGADISAEDFGQPVYDMIQPTAWTNVTPLNGYSLFTSQPAQYRKIGDQVQLRGRLVVGSAVFGVAAFQMPVGMRPPSGLVVMTPVSTGTTWVAGPVDFRADGSYLPFGITGVTDVSIPLWYSIS